MLTSFRALRIKALLVFPMAYFYLDRSYENRVSKHFVIFLNFRCLIAGLLCCLLTSFVFLACLVVTDLCRSGCRQNYYLTPLPPFFSLPTILSLTQVTVISLKSWGQENQEILVTLRKVSRRASCKALRWDKVITIRRVCIVQYRIICSFHLAKRINLPDPG